MPELSFSLKDVAEVVSSTAKAFDDLYSTLRRLAIDGWSGIGVVMRDVNNRRDEEQVRDYILLLRNLQIQKIEASIAIVHYINHTSQSGWSDLRAKLFAVLTLTHQFQKATENSTNISIPMKLGEKFPALVEVTSARIELVGNLLDQKPRPAADVSHLEKLVDLFDLETRLIGKCADLLTEFVEERRSKR